MAENEKAVAPEWPLIVKLRKPVQVFKDIKHEITFREPTGADTRAVLASGGQIVEFDPISTPARVNPFTSGMLLMMARLSGWPTSSIDLMNPQDQASCSWRLSPFFMPMEAEDSTPSTEP